VTRWEATADDIRGTEFFLLSPTEDPRHVELLAMVVNLHADARYRLRVGSTVSTGQPWMDDPARQTTCSCRCPIRMVRGSKRLNSASVIGIRSSALVLSVSWESYYCSVDALFAGVSSS
jgi:hypothetical protein